MKYLIFDFDGTLANSIKALITAWNTIAQKYQLKELEFKDIAVLKKLSLTERSKFLNLPLHKVPVILPQFYQLYHQSLQHIHLFDGIKEVPLELEQKGYHIVIISSHAKDTILAFLNINGIQCVAEVLCSNPFAGKDKVLKKFLKAPLCHHLIYSILAMSYEILSPVKKQVSRLFG